MSDCGFLEGQIKSLPYFQIFVISSFPVNRPWHGGMHAEEHCVMLSQRQEDWSEEEVESQCSCGRHLSGFQPEHGS
jgi:hypothetical protein